MGNNLARVLYVCMSITFNSYLSWNRTRLANEYKQMGFFEFQMNIKKH